jgi:hypothetical protein
MFLLVSRCLTLKYRYINITYSSNNSIDDSLRHTLSHSRLDISQVPVLSEAIASRRIKIVSLQSLRQLIALVELLNTTLRDERVLLLMDQLHPILQLQKVTV